MISRKNYWNFVNGFISEATPLTYPDGSTKDERNFQLLRNGSRIRRYGHEEIKGWHDTGVTEDAQYAIKSFVWEFPDNLATTALLVIQLGQYLRFYDALTFNPIGNALAVNVGGNANYLGRMPIDFASTNGVLVCVGRTLNKPFYISADFDTETFTITEYDLLVRDLWGVEDGLDVDFRPRQFGIPDRPGPGLSPEHQYNIFNQGWGTTPPNVTGGRRATHTAFADQFYPSGESTLPPNEGEEWPSNADIAFFGKEVKVDRYGAFVPNLVRYMFLGSTPAPKGKAIINIFDRGESRRIYNDKVSKAAFDAGEPDDEPPPDTAPIGYHYPMVGTTMLPEDTDSGRPSSVAFYAGRIFYAGIDGKNKDGDGQSPLLTGAVLYSQLLENLDAIGKCYQEADPTSEEISDLVATDGGIIFIPDASNIVDIIPIGNALVVFSGTGIWSIQGSEAGFSADDFQVKKISEVGVLNSGSIIDLEGTVVFWAQNGIYSLQVEAGLGSYQIESLSREKIQTFYSLIPVAAKFTAQGYFDPQEQTLHWLYNPDANNTVDNFYTHELRYDLTLNAWYKYEFSVGPTPYPFIAGFATSPYVSQLAGGTEVTPTYLVMEAGSPATPYRINFSRLLSRTYTDFGVNYKSWLRPGTELLANGYDRKQDVTLVFYFERTEFVWNAEQELVVQSGCLLSAYWDFADDVSAVIPSDKVDEVGEVYKLLRHTLPSDIPEGEDTPFEYGRSVIVTRQKIRGRGLSLDLLLQSEDGKDCRLLGWTSEFNTDGPDAA